jgi:hypothetical protein
LAAPDHRKRGRAEKSLEAGEIGPSCLTLIAQVSHILEDSAAAGVIPAIFATLVFSRFLNNDPTTG